SVGLHLVNSLTRTRAPSWIERGSLRGGSFETTGFERARPAIVLAGSVVDHVVLHHTATRHGEPSAVALEGLASRAPVCVADMVISEVLAREGAVWALGFVEDWDVRLDPTVMNKPVQHLGRVIGGVTDQPGAVESEAFERALDHALGCRHLGLPDRC